MLAVKFSLATQTSWPFCFISITELHIEHNSCTLKNTGKNWVLKNGSCARNYNCTFHQVI